MPLPTVITDLSPTASANFPSGTGDSPDVLDNVQRAHAAFIAQLRDGTVAHAAPVKSALVDADEVHGGDSAVTFGQIRSTWTSIKAFLKTYFDTIYPAGSGTSTGANTGDQTPTSLGLVIGTNVQAYNANLTAINQALTTTSSPSFTAVTAALTGTASATAGQISTHAALVTGVHGITNAGPYTMAITANTSLGGTNTGDNAVNSNYSGLVTNANHSGDATGATALTLATVNSNVGSFGSATQAGVFAVNGKGLITAASAATITPAVGSITGLGTGIAAALAINAGSAGAPILQGGAASVSSLTTSGHAGVTTAASANSILTLGANVSDYTFMLYDSASSPYGYGVRSNQMLQYVPSGGKISWGLMSAIPAGTFTEWGYINATDFNVGTKAITGGAASVTTLAASALVTANLGVNIATGYAYSLNGISILSGQHSGGLYNAYVNSAGNGAVTGYQNNGFGYQAIAALTSGTYNTAIGQQALLNVTSGSGNIGIGSSAGSGITTGSNNVIIGGVTGLAAGLSNNIIIADGAGNQRITSDSVGAITIPGTLALTANYTVTAGGALAIENVIAPTLVNSWANQGGVYKAAGYWKDAFGVVHLHGVITGGAASSTAFALPSGYFMAVTQIFPSASGYIVVNLSGYVQPSTTGPVYLDGISFRTT